MPGSATEYGSGAAATTANSATTGTAHSASVRRRGESRNRSREGRAEPVLDGSVLDGSVLGEAGREVTPAI
ncbi:hypothetical protein GCM10027091_13310 [Streptomyces daliensis]